MKICKLLMGIIPLVGLTMLTGCTVLPTRGKLASKNECLEYAKKECPNEKFAYVSKEKVKADLPTEIYHFKSEERDLEFCVEASFKHMTLGSTLISWAYMTTKDCNYDQMVLDIYKDELIKIFEEVPCYKGKVLAHSFAIETYEDIDDVVNAINEANKLYAKELEYNDKKWLSNNTLDLVDAYISCNPFDPEQSVFTVISDSSEYGPTYAHFSINGLEDKQEIEDKIYEEINNYYTIDTYSINLGDKIIEKEFPSAYGCISDRGSVKGKINSNKARFICTNSKLEVESGNDITSEIYGLIEQEVEANNRDTDNPDRIENYNVSEYEKDGRKCYSVQYSVSSHPYKERNSWNYVELYEDVDSQYYYRVQINSASYPLDVEEIIDYFGL